MSQTADGSILYAPLMPQQQNRRSKSGRRVVEHAYHDHANDVGSDNKQVELAISNRGGVMTPFPLKLYGMLQEIEDKSELSNIVSWQPHGRCFLVHKPKEFVEQVMPMYFNQTKLPSFQRQLNLYGFCRLTTGPDAGAYYHELFLRGKPHLIPKIQRMRIKGTGVRPRSNPNKEPNFYAMPPILVDEEQQEGEETTRPSSPALPSLVEDDSTTTTKTERPRPDAQPSQPLNVACDEDDDLLMTFAGRHFHFLSPEEVMKRQVLENNLLMQKNKSPSSEMNSANSDDAALSAFIASLL